MMLILLFLFLIMVIIYSISLPRKTKGIIFFDIDDTLTTMVHSDQDIIIEYCINAGYDVGIITASDRPIHYIVNYDGTPNTQISPWMSKTLARYLYETNFRTYNTWSLTMGEKYKFPNFKHDKRIFGWKKGWQMEVAIREFGYDRRKCFLFDDQKLVLESARDVCVGPKYILVDNNSCDKQLDIKLIKYLIK